MLDNDHILKLKLGMVVLNAQGTAFIIKEIKDLDNIILETLYNKEPKVIITRDVDYIYESFQIYSSEVEYLLYHQPPKGRIVRVARRVTDKRTKL